MIYFDSAATTTVDPEVLEAMLPFYTEHYGNPSSIHNLGRRTRAAIERARKSVAKHLQASTGEIFFTSGGTESNNLAIKSSIYSLGFTRIITSKVEHSCVLNTCQYLANQGITVDYLPIDQQGYFDLEQLEKLLSSSKEKTLVSLIHANNEIGTINNWKKIGQLAKAHNALFHADTVQSVAHYPIDLQDIEVDFISGAAHKFHGPKGIGFIYINSDVKLEPIIHGGAQERNMRAGTENVAQIVGLATALDLAYRDLEQTTSHIQGLKDYAIQQIQTHFPQAEFNGDCSKNSLYTVLNVALPTTMSADMLLFNLDIKGIYCSVGSACSSGADKGSHVIQALHRDNDYPSVRISFSKHSNSQEIDQLIQALKEII